MKTLIMLTIFSLGCLSLFALNLLTENFNGPSLPTGWTPTGASVDNWMISNFANAGGTIPELKFHYFPNGTGVRSIVSPAINTILGSYGAYQMTLTFKFKLEDYPNNPNSYTIGVKTTTDNVNFTTVWSQTTSTTIAAQTKTITITGLVYSSNFRFCFFFSGDPNDINGWFIDNVSLNLTHYAVAGTLYKSLSPYYLTDSWGVPPGYTLTIQPGVSIISSGLHEILVAGNIQAQGTEADSIIFTASNHTTGWKGININSSAIADTFRFEHCRLEYGNKPAQSGGNYSDFAGSVMYIDSTSPIKIDHCVFRNNHSLGFATVALDNDYHANITNSSFYNNNAVDCSVLVGLESNSAYIYMNKNFVYNNFCTISGLSLITGTMLFAVQEINFLMDSCDFYNNNGTPTDCYFASLSTSDGYISLTNSIFFNPTNYNDAVNFHNVVHSGCPCSVTYCDLTSDISGIGYTGNPPSYAGIISSSPTFANVGLGDFTLLSSSPCIDTGNPAQTDPDNTRKDMGALPFWKSAKPVHVIDVPYDQGRDVEIFWERSWLDASFLPNSFYSVWRLDSASRSDAVLLDSPMELNNQPTTQPIYWIDRHEAWLYLGQVSAYNFDNYCYIAPTQQDSSSTGTHSGTFLVVYQNNNGFWVSPRISGYSVDNIAPDPLRDLAIHKSTGNLQLSWSPIATGTYNGSSFPELNVIAYKIYYGDTPDFINNPANYLSTTTNPSLLINSLQAARKFYRVVVTDNP